MSRYQCREPEPKWNIVTQATPHEIRRDHFTGRGDSEDAKDDVPPLLRAIAREGLPHVVVGRAIEGEEKRNGEPWTTRPTDGIVDHLPY